MATQTEETEEEGQSKRYHADLGKQLTSLINNRVEVRRIDEGFLGSWHEGEIIECNRGEFRIKYVELLCDNSSDRLVEWVAQDTIRPLPPKVDLPSRSLHYGKCVDVLHKDVWWEGVIFDHENSSSDERKVFFPDMGDEMTVQLKDMRATQDWDEVRGEWRFRDDWLLLELIEEVEKEWPPCVSVKQIWYDLRVKQGFESIREWTNTSRQLWKDLLLELIRKYVWLAAKGIGEECHSVSGFSEPAFDGLMNHGTFDGSFSMVSCEPDSLLDKLASFESPSLLMNVAPNCPDLDKLGGGSEKSSSPISPQRLDGHGSVLPPSALSESPLQEDRKVNSRPKYSKNQWLPAGKDLVPEPEYCPDGISDYINAHNSASKGKTLIALNARKHLSYLGWKIEFVRDRASNAPKMRYTSPEKVSYLSLIQVCLLLEPTSRVLSSSISEAVKRADYNTANNMPLLTEKAHPISEVVTRADFHTANNIALLTEKAHPYHADSELGYESRDTIKNSTLITQHGYDYVSVEGHYFPQSVVEYASLEGRDQKSRKVGKDAKRHLSAVGWKFYFQPKGDRKELRYEAPCGKVFNSLRQACIWYVSEGPSSLRNTSTHKHMEKKFPEGQMAVKPLNTSPFAMELKENLTASSSMQSFPKALDELGGCGTEGIDVLQRKRKRDSEMNSKNEKLRLHKNVEESQPLINQRDDVNPERRARQAGTPSTYQNPSTVLSWLIDDNVVLPNSKVYYRGRKDGAHMKDGITTREGIKCMCCQSIFTLSKFEAHAGSTYHRPAANIFLEDGRSLRDCQLQLKCDKPVRSKSYDSHGAKVYRQSNSNDQICSFCRYGGELILCDRCPSSFHMTCLGLEEIPDGDWFCPSCCCCICNSSKCNEHYECLEPSMSDRLFSCSQCEHQYHVGCLRNKALVKHDGYPEGNWFCNKKCEEIYVGLQKLLGKPIPIGLDNLTWTLLKYTKTEDSDQRSLNNDQLMENYSKLNVALGVMHECFEPVKEPLTGGDLVEDVIFSRWSELKRLNCQGFYTVLLEKDEQLVTVATMRVYGEKVAEIPLVGTRFKFRQMGMCRILMHEIEKKLMELGVERLVLPSARSVLKTWTTSFGFSQMSVSERLTFMRYNFLEFQGTILCHKIIKNNKLCDVNQLKETQPNVCEKKIDLMDVEGSSAVSEVIQVVGVEEIDSFQRYSGGTACKGGNVFVPSAARSKMTLI